jgi:hypothetical protein
MRAILSFWMLLFFSVSGGLGASPSIFEEPTDYGCERQTSFPEPEETSLKASNSGAMARPRNSKAAPYATDASSGAGARWSRPRSASDLRCLHPVLRI